MTTPLLITIGTNAKRVGAYLVRMFGGYLAGIIACVLFTPAALYLIDAPVGLFFVPLASLGYFAFYFLLSPAYVFGNTLFYWLVYVLGLAVLLSGMAAPWLRQKWLIKWRSTLIGFPIGFVGTLGIYYSAAQSI